MEFGISMHHATRSDPLVALSMNCPTDDAVLVPLEIDSLTLDTCPQCSGLWFDSDELRHAEYLADPNVEWMDFDIWRHIDRFRIEPRTHVCPKCKTPMVRLRYGETHVEVDHCSACGGVWIAAGGFEKIIGALEHEAAQKSSSAYLQETLREALVMLRHPRSFAAEWGNFKHVYELLKVRLLVEHPALVKAILESRGAAPL